MTWTLRDLPPLNGKVIACTGASSGIGRWATEHFVRAGATVVLAVITEGSGQKVVNEIRTRNARRLETLGKMVVMQVDLSSLENVRIFAERFRDKFDRLDVLLLNAGVFMEPYQISADGYEMHFAVNHLAHFLLTGLLLDRLKNTEGSRVVTVSSLAHKNQKELDYDVMKGIDSLRYKRLKGYCQSKLCNMLFAFELSRRLKKANIRTLSLATHPGLCHTNLGKSADQLWWKALKLLVLPFICQSARMGSMPLVMASTYPEARSGDFFGPKGLMEFGGYPKRVQPSLKALDPEEARILWEESERCVDFIYL